MTSTNGHLRFAADVGGTFTDVIALDDRGGVWTHKLPSTPPNFEQAVLNALKLLLEKTNRPGESVSEVAHGTTVATNAILERRGARTALVTTKGFRDVLELRRVRAPQMYDLFWDKPKPLVERYLRFEINERLSAAGDVLMALDEPELWQLKEKLEREQIESVGVCFLHAYAFPRHERIVGEFLRKHLPKVLVSLSSEVLRVRKEYERTATTVVNAYVRPIMGRCINAMRAGLNSQRVTAPLLIMQSAGGLTPAADAAARPVYVMESGPAAGVLAASYIARRLSIRNIITLDIGGTTAKASLIEDGRVAYSPEYEVGASLSASNRLVGGGGERIIAPTIDIAEVGAGGGSLAYLDKAGGLHVGPRSAGALPGPACYQQGGKEPTLTDADVMLGYIRPGKLANGDITIDLEAAHRAIHDRIAKPLGIDVMRAAEGIHRIANSNTLRALRAVSTERGRDPREFALVAFGGNGPVHAANLAAELRVKQTLVPPLPGLFSAVGLLFGGIEHHDARSCQLTGEALTPTALQSLVDEMRQTMLAQFRSEGFPADQVGLICDMDIRFLGQASEIRLSVETPQFTTAILRALEERFKVEHERLYGHRSELDNPVEVVAVRLIGRGGKHAGESQLRPAERGDAKAESSRRAYFGEKWGMVDTPVIARGQIDQPAAGPFLIDEYDSTTVVAPGVKVWRDQHENLVIDTNGVSHH
ncbi:MAG: hydantoinase [Acidobacteria bacterium]|nr:MAG: hydantoinase [Acidobacteriota bacterium]